MPQCHTTAGLGASMAEEAEGRDTGAEALGAGVDPAAIALALGGASREEADNFLRNQNALLRNQSSLIDIQKHHLTEQFKNLRLNIWEKRLGVLLRVATGVVGLIVGVGLALMIWDAAHADGLVIEEFSVPPDLASRGITGQVVASQLLDKLTLMQRETNSARAARSYSNYLGNDLKVEIPDTGISVGEIYRFLRGWLGHETHITGEIFRTANGLAITARTNGDVGATYTGSDADFNTLVQQAAENLYGSTQPYRYATYLANHGRADASIAILHTLVGPNEPAVDRGWAYNLWGILSQDIEGPAATRSRLKRGLEIYPELFVAQGNVALLETNMGQSEAALRDYQAALSLLNSHGPEVIAAETIDARRNNFISSIDVALGDYHDATQLRKTAFVTTSAQSPTTEIAVAEIGEHDPVAARDVLANPVPGGGQSPGYTALMTIRAAMQLDSEAQDWSAVLAEGEQAAALAQKYPGLRPLLLTMTDPLSAYAESRQSNVASADARISATSADCYACVRMRGTIAAVEGDWGKADYWFARAAALGPSLPNAYADWGQSLLERGDPDAAIAKFTVANQKGPKFADPLEMWGEALMKKNRSDLALAKFEEAEKYAPNWGRLHLKWGEALAYAKRRDDAQKQYAVAAGLDLSNDDRAELTRVGHG